MTAHAEPPSPPDRYGPLFWVSLAVGLGLCAIGVASFLAAYADLETRIGFALWIAGADLGHDVVLAPVVCAIGLLVARMVPGQVRPPVELGLVASGVVLLVAFHPLRDSAAHTGNPTWQPQDSVPATLAVLATVWVIAAIWAGVRLVRR